MFGVLADGHVNTVLVKNGCRIDLARAFRGGVLVFFALGRIAVVFPGNLEIGGITFLYWFRVERVTPAVATTEEHEFLSVHLTHRWRAPLAVEDVRADVRVVFGDEFAGLLVQGDEAGGVGRGDIDVGPVLAVGGAGVHQVVHDLHGAVRGVVRKNAEFVHHVIDPDDVGVVWTNLRFRFAGADDILRLVHERTVVAVGEAFGVQADDLAAAGHQVNAITFHARRGEQAQTFPVVHFARGEFRDDELPEELTGLFVEAKQNAAVALVLRIAGVLVDDDVAVGLRAEPGHPLDVFGGAQVDLVGAGLGFARVEPVGQAPGRRIHVAAGVVAAPARPVRRDSGRD